MELTEFLETSGITRKALAAMCGTTYKTIWALTNGHHDPHLSLALKIEKFTGGQVKCKDLLPKKLRDTKQPERARLCPAYEKLVDNPKKSASGKRNNEGFK